MRNYKVGDWVLVDTVCGTKWGYIHKLSENSEILRVRVMFDNGWDIYPILAIKTARKPRLGGKEARDIVAMLARNGNKHHNEVIQHMKDNLSSYESDLESYDDVVDNFYTEHELRNLIGLQIMSIKGMYRGKRASDLLSDYRTAKAILKEQL
jgi:hypothetical protein